MNLITDKQEALKLVAENGWNLRHCSPKLRDDKEVVFVAVTSDGAALRYASKRLRSDKEVVATAAIKTECSVDYIPKEFWVSLLKDVNGKKQKQKQKLKLKLKPMSEAPFDEEILLYKSVDERFLGRIEQEYCDDGGEYTPSYRVCFFAQKDLDGEWNYVDYIDECPLKYFIGWTELQEVEE